MRLPHLRQFVVAVILHTCCIAPVRAELRVAQPSVDLGPIRGGQKLTHRFELTNLGVEPVEIKEVQRGCGCLAPTLDRRVVPSKENAILIVELRMLGQADGPHTWNLQVQYRVGQETKSIGLSLRGTVKSDVTVQPAILGLHVAKSVEQEVTLTDSRAMPLRVVAAEARAPGVHVIKIDRAGKTTKVLLRADATKLDPGRHEGVLTITTDDADYGQLTVPIVVTKAAATTVTFAPEQVVLRVPENATTASALVRLRSTNDQPVRIAKIEPSDPAFVCTWAAGPGNDATLRVQAQAAHVTKSMQGHVEVYLTSPAVEAVMVPVFIAVGK